MLSLERQLWLLDGADGGTRYQQGKHVLSHHPHVIPIDRDVRCVRSVSPTVKPLKHPDCSDGGSHWPLWWSPLNGQFITNGWCGSSISLTFCTFGAGFTDFGGYWGGNSYNTAACRNNTFLHFRESWWHTVKHVTPGTAQHNQEFYSEPLSSSSGAVICCAHREPQQ